MATGLEHLWVYTLAEDLEIEVHRLTKKFPRDEFYRSVDQLRRSSAAVANNIAESYHKATAREKARFIVIALGEAEETKRNFMRSLRKEFLNQGDGGRIIERYTILLKGLHAYRRFIELGRIPKPETNN